MSLGGPFNEKVFPGAGFSPRIRNRDFEGHVTRREKIRPGNGPRVVGRGGRAKSLDQGRNRFLLA